MALLPGGITTTKNGTAGTRINHELQTFLSIYGSYEQIATWTIGEVALPYGPEKLEYSKKCDKEAIPQTGRRSYEHRRWLNNWNLFGRQYMLMKLNLTLKYGKRILMPLLALIGKQVTILCPINGLNGEWLLDSFTPSRDSKLSIYKYNLRLSKGSLNINIADYDD